jgi:hypothetical protein
VDVSQTGSFEPGNYSNVRIISGGLPGFTWDQNRPLSDGSVPKDGVNYYWRIWSYEGADTHGVHSLTPNPQVTAPNCTAEPSIASVSPDCDLGNHLVSLSWQGSGDGWYVDISPDSSFENYWNKNVSFLTSTTAPAGFTSTTLPPLAFQEGQTYSWRVWDTQNWQNGLDFEIPACPKSGGIPLPARPASLSASTDCLDESPLISFAWSQPDQVDGWFVDVSKTGSFEPGQYSNVHIPNTGGLPGFTWDQNRPLSDGNIPEAGTPYYWRVWAYRGAIENGIHSAQPDPTITASDCGSSSVTEQNQFAPAIILSANQVNCDAFGKAVINFLWEPGTVFDPLGNIIGYSDEQWLDLKIDDGTPWDNPDGSFNFVNSGPFPGSANQYVWRDIEPNTPHRWRIANFYQGAWYHSELEGTFSTSDCGVSVTTASGEFIKPVTIGVSNQICNADGKWTIILHWEPGSVKDEAGNITELPQEQFIDLKYDDGTDWLNPDGSQNYVHTQTLVGSQNNYTWSGIEPNQAHIFRVANLHNGTWYHSDATIYSTFATENCGTHLAAGQTIPRGNYNNPAAQELASGIRKYSGESVYDIEGNFKGLGLINYLNLLEILEARSDYFDLQEDIMAYQMISDSLDYGYSVGDTLGFYTTFVSNPTLESSTLNSEGTRYLDEKYALLKEQVKLENCKRHLEVFGDLTRCFLPPDYELQMGIARKLEEEAIKFLGSNSPLLHGLVEYDRKTKEFYPQESWEGDYAAVNYYLGKKLESISERKAVEIYGYVNENFNHNISPIPGFALTDQKRLESTGHKVQVLGAGFLIGFAGLDNVIPLPGKGIALNVIKRLPGINRLVAREGAETVARSLAREGLESEDEAFQVVQLGSKLDNGVATDAEKAELARLIKPSGAIETAINLVKNARITFVPNGEYGTLLDSDRTYINSVLGTAATDVWPDVVSKLGIAAPVKDVFYEHLGEGVFKRAFKVDAIDQNDRVFTFVVKMPKDNEIQRRITPDEFQNYVYFGQRGISQIQFTNRPAIRTFHQDPSQVTAVLVEEFIEGPTTKALGDTARSERNAIYKSVGELGGKLWESSPPSSRKTAVNSIPDNHLENTITSTIDGAYVTKFIDIDISSTETFSHFIINELVTRSTSGRIPRAYIGDYLHGLTSYMLRYESPQETARLLKQSADDFRAMINDEDLQRAFQTKFVSNENWRPWPQDKKAGFTNMANDIDKWADENLTSVQGASSTNMFRYLFGETFEGLNFGF